MSRKLTILFIILLVVGIIAWLGYRYMFQDAPKSAENERTDYVITAAELIKAFQNNEADANVKYAGKVLEVRGTVDQIITNDESKSVSVFLREPGESMSVKCTFDLSVENPETFEIGKTITVKGFCNGALFDVNMNRCFIVD